MAKHKLALDALSDRFGFKRPLVLLLRRRRGLLTAGLTPGSYSMQRMSVSHLAASYKSSRA